MKQIKKENTKKRCVKTGLLAIGVPYSLIVGMGVLANRYPFLYRYNFIVALLALCIFFFFSLQTYRLIKTREIKTDETLKKVNTYMKTKYNAHLEKAKTWGRKLTMCLLALFVSLSMFSIADVAIEAATSSTITLASPNGQLRVKANAEGQGYQIESKDTSGTYLKQHYGSGIADGGESAANSNGSIVSFFYKGRQYLAGNKYYITSLTDAGNKITNMFSFLDNDYSGSTITTRYQASFSLPSSEGGGTLVVSLTQKLTVTNTYVKKDFSVNINATVQDMRLLHGGDTYFGGKDSGFPSYNPLNNSVYIVPLLSGTDKDLNAGIMQFSGDTETPANHYFAGYYSEGRTQMLTGRLNDFSIPITSTAAVDGGYYLEWDAGDGSKMDIKSTERFIAEGGAVQILAPSPVNAIYGSEYSADFTAFNIGNQAVNVSLVATSPAATTKIYDGAKEVSQISLAANETKSFTVKGIAGQTQVSGVIQVVATYSYSGTSKTYTAKTDYATKDGPAIKSAAITSHTKDEIAYRIETNKTGIPVSVKLRDNVTGNLVSSWSDSFTPTTLFSDRTHSVTGLVEGRMYNLNVTIEGNLTPNASAVFIHYSDAPPVGLSSTMATHPGFNNGTISGVSSDMEYRKDGETTYTKVSGSSISSLTAGDYYVRYRDTTGEINGWHLTSADVKVPVLNKTYTVTQGTISDGVWSGDASVDIKEKLDGTMTFIPTSGYELLKENVTFSGNADISVNNDTGTITLANVSKGGVINVVCTQTQDTKDTILIDAELAKLKAAFILNPLQAINTDLNTKIYENGKSKEPSIAYSFKNTAYTNGHLVSSLNNTATDQVVSLEIELTKGNITKTKTIAVTFLKENVAPIITAIKAKEKNGSGLSVLLNNLTFKAFFNKEVEISIEAEDENSGIKSISYQLVSTDDPSSVEPKDAWIDLNDNPAIFTIAPSFKGVIFTKTIDHAGNVSLNSYSKKGALISENNLPTVTYKAPLTTSENDSFFNNSQNISVAINDDDISSHLNKTNYHLYKKNGNTWEEIDAKKKENLYLFSDQKTSVTYDDSITTSGRYKVSVSGEDFASNVNLESNGYLNVDVDKPSVALTSTAPSGWVNEHGITLDLNDGEKNTSSGLFTLSLIKDGQSPTLLKTYGEDTYQESDYTYNVNVEGTHTYQFQLIDKAGNTTLSSVYTVKFDQSKPNFPLINKDVENGETLDGISWYKQSKPNVEVTPTSNEIDRSTNTSYYRFNDGTKEELNTTMNFSSQLKEGINTIEVFAQDGAGNIAMHDSDNFIKETMYVDTQSPEVESIETSTINDDIVSKVLNALTFNIFYKESVKVSVKANDATSGVSSIAYEQYSSNVENDTYVPTSWTKMSVDKNNMISFIVDASFKGNIYTKAIDKAGNESEEAKRKQVALVVEDVAPTITLLSSNTSESATSTYQKGSQDVKIKIADTNITSWMKQTNIEVSKWDGSQYQKDTNLSKAGTYAISDKLSELNETITLAQSGKYRICTKAEDQAGNKSVEKISYINVDVDTPTLEFTSIAPSKWVNRHMIKMDLKDVDSGIKTLYLQIDGGEKNAIKTFSENSVKYEYAVNTLGSHTYQFSVEDGVGNTISSSAYVVKLDTTSLPFPTINRELENGNQVGDISWYKQEKPMVSITPAAQEVDRAKRISVISIDDHEAIETSETSDVDVSDLLKEGKNTIRVSTYDEAGNASLNGNKEYREEFIYIDSVSAKIDFVKLDGKELNDKQVTYRNRDSKIQIKASDQTSGVSHIAYALCEGHNTTPKQGDWKDEYVKNDDSIYVTLSESKNYTLVVKAYDKAGNEASSPSVTNFVIDKTKPNIQNIENGKTYYTDQVFGVKDENLLNVKINDREIKDYRVEANQNEAKTLLLTSSDQAGNVETYKIYTKPISSLMTPIASITLNNVTKANQKDLLAIKNELMKLDQKNASSDQIQRIAQYLKQVNGLLDKIVKTQQDIEYINSKTPNKSVDKISIKDESTLLENIKRIDALLNGNNLDATSRKQLKEEKEMLQKMYDRIVLLKTLSQQKTGFDKQENMNSKTFAKFEKDIVENMNIKMKVKNNADEKIKIKHLLMALSPDDILNYEGQEIEIVMSVKEIKQPSTPVRDGYERIKAFDFTIHKKVSQKSEEVNELAQPIEIAIAIKKDKDATYILDRHHEGKTKSLSDLTPKENQVSVKSARFSTYELLKSKQNTISLTIFLWPIVGAAIVIAGILFYKQKRKEK